MALVALLVFVKNRRGNLVRALWLRLQKPWWTLVNLLNLGQMCPLKSRVRKQRSPGELDVTIGFGLYFLVTRISHILEYI